MAITALNGSGVFVPACVACAVAARICAAAVATFCGIGVGATTTGVTYTVSIDVANRSTASGSCSGNFSFGGQNHIITASSHTFITLTWVVVASSDSTLIDITADSGANPQLLIDNVSVTPGAAVTQFAIVWDTAKNTTADTDVATEGTFLRAVAGSTVEGNGETVNEVVFTSYAATASDYYPYGGGQYNTQSWGVAGAGGWTDSLAKTTTNTWGLNSRHGWPANVPPSGLSAASDSAWCP